LPHSHDAELIAAESAARTRLSRLSRRQVSGEVELFR